MYRRILVALDGSELAERVLPYVEALAARFGSEVVLVRATTPLAKLATSVAGSVYVGTGASASALALDEAVETERQTAVQYLSSASQRLRARGFWVTYEHTEGEAASAITDVARQIDADLIAMTTHGRGGIGRLVYGSVAGGVLRTSHCPVLMVRVDSEA